LGLHRSIGRYQNKGPTDWLLRLRERLEALSLKHPRLGYRKLTRLLRAEGWSVGKKLVRDSGLRVKRWWPRRRRRGQSTGTIPTRAERLNHVWSWDFVADRTDTGVHIRGIAPKKEDSIRVPSENFVCCEPQTIPRFPSAWDAPTQHAQATSPRNPA